MNYQRQNPRNKNKYKIDFRSDKIFLLENIFNGMTSKSTIYVMKYQLGMNEIIILLYI